MNEKFILTIIDKFSTGSIGELDFSDGTYHLTLRKDKAGTTGPASEADPPGKAADSLVHLGISGSAGANDAQDGRGEKITSPIVATFYSAAGPDSPPFVKPGSRVKAGETLCILEAMKMMNHLEAEYDCEITGTHAASGELVEYGQILFTVKRL